MAEAPAGTGWLAALEWLADRAVLGIQTIAIHPLIVRHASPRQRRPSLPARTDATAFREILKTGILTPVLDTFAFARRQRDIAAVTCPA